MPFQVEIDSDDHLCYEVNSFLKQAINLLWVPLINSIPERHGKWVAKSSRDIAQVRKYAASFWALEILYAFNGKNPNRDFLDGAFTRLWMNTSNGKSIRNRLKLVKNLLRESMRFLFLQNQRINILNLGCGSARAVIEVLAEEKSSAIPLKALLIDRSQRAIHFSQKLAKELSLSWPVQWIRTHIWEADNQCRGFDPNLIEMVGILDYLDDEEATNLVEMTHRLLQSGGILITGNIRDNPERAFITKTMRWPMIYRNPKNWVTLPSKLGFPLAG